MFYAKYLRISLLFALLIVPLSADSLNKTSISNGTMKKDYLAIVDVPHDAIPDSILTKDEMIIGVIIGFLPKPPIAEPRLKYRAVESGRIKEIPISKIVQVYDGKTGRLIELPSFFERHTAPIVLGVTCSSLVVFVLYTFYSLRGMY